MNDEPVLTPNTILHGRIGGRLAPPSDDDIQCSLRNRWRRIQEVLRHFWERWKREMLPLLHNRRKWLYPVTNLKVKDIVIVVDNKLPRGQWRFGKVIDVYPGSDGLVRTAKIGTLQANIYVL